jgi:signal transduction histidine kinase
MKFYKRSSLNAKKLVEMMGGKIWTESKLGEGSNFHFTIMADSPSIKPTSRKEVEAWKEASIKLIQIMIFAYC